MQDDIAQQIDEQIRYLHLLRSMVPRLSTDLACQTEFLTAPYSRNKGLGIWFHFSSPLTSEFINAFNDLAHWINQSFILRLYAVLESNGLVSQTTHIRPDIEGHDQVDIVRQLWARIGAI